MNQGGDSVDHCGAMQKIKYEQLRALTVSHVHQAPLHPNRVIPAMQQGAKSCMLDVITCNS